MIITGFGEAAPDNPNMWWHGTESPVRQLIMPYKWTIYGPPSQYANLADVRFVASHRWFTDMHPADMLVIVWV